MLDFSAYTDGGGGIVTPDRRWAATDDFHGTDFRWYQPDHRQLQQHQHRITDGSTGGGTLTGFGTGVWNLGATN